VWTDTYKRLVTWRCRHLTRPCELWRREYDVHKWVFLQLCSECSVTLFEVPGYLSVQNETADVKPRRLCTAVTALLTELCYYDGGTCRRILIHVSQACVQGVPVPGNVSSSYLCSTGVWRVIVW